MKTKNAQNDDLRTEILEAFATHDHEGWKRYHASRLTRRHAAQAALEAAFEAQLADTARQLAEDDLDDEVFSASLQQTYMTALLIAGYTQLEASLMANAFCNSYTPPRRRHSYGL